MDWKLRLGVPDITMNRNPRDKHPDIDAETNIDSDVDTDIGIEVGINSDIDNDTKY